MLGNRQRVRELLAGVDFELFGDGHVRRALEHLRIHGVGDDRLVFARQILVQVLDELSTRHFGVRHWASSAEMTVAAEHVS